MDSYLSVREEKPYVVVVTPTKNEEAIIRRFLACCSQFADKIVLLDQNSTDGTLAIARHFAKVEIHISVDSEYSEENRQKQLLRLARESRAHRLLILALDADEIPTANIFSSPEWNSVLNAAPGTVLFMPRLEILPNFERVLIHNRWPFGYMDDGVDHIGDFMHSVRIPISATSKQLLTSQIRVLHYSFVRPTLQAAKNRFYCVKENLRASRPLMCRRSIYRYDFIANRLSTMISETFKAEWIAAYEANGIDMTSILEEQTNWFDKEVEHHIAVEGGVPFHFDPVWNRRYTFVQSTGRVFRRPPRGLAGFLALCDRLYTACPFKQSFEQLMEGVRRAYILCNKVV